MKKKKLMYVKFGLDIVMAITFVLFFNKQVLGGLTFHEIAGIAIAAIFFTHVLLNWQWVKNVTLKLFDRQLSLKTKLGYLLNLMLLITMAFIIISGILISRVVFPNLNIGNEQWFKVSHISISFLVLFLVAVHVGLHWKWVINVVNNIVKLKKPHRYFGIIAKIAAVALLMFGSYEIYSSNFIMQVQGVTRVFTPSSSQTPGGDGRFEKGTPPERFESRDGQLTKGNPSEGFESGQVQFGNGTPPQGFESGQGQFANGASPQGFEGREGQFETPNPLGVIIKYFSIMSVFIIIIYYMEKFIFKYKRKKRKTNFSEADVTTA